QTIDAIQNSAVTGKEPTGILHSGGPFDLRFTQVADLTEDPNQQTQGNQGKNDLIQVCFGPHQFGVHDPGNHSKKKASEGALYGFIRTNRACQLVFTNRLADKERKNIVDPDDHEQKHQLVRPFALRYIGQDLASNGIIQVPDCNQVTHQSAQVQD